MTKPAPLFLLALCLSICTLGCGVTDGALVGGTFTNTGSDVVSRFFHRASLLADGKVIVSGGMTLQIFPPSLMSLKTVAFYDPISAAFTTSFTPIGGGPPVIPQLITARSSHTQTTLPDGRVLITGGRTAASGTNPGTAIDTVEIFSPQTGIVSSGASMSQARAGHTATLISGGRVVVAGGIAWQVFDSGNNTWSSAASLAYSRMDHAAVRLPDYFGAGSDGVLLIAGSGSGGDTMEILNPAAATTTPTSPTLAIPVDDLSAEMLDNGQVLIVGGQDLTNGNTIVDSYRYDPIGDILTSAPPPPSIPAGISDHRSIALGRYVAIFGGESQVSGTDTELTYAAIYDSLADAWIYQGNMLHPHDDFPAVLLNDGRILLIGGGGPLFGNEAPTANTELFTPTHIDPGDLNNDGKVNELDIPIFNAAVLDPSSATTIEFCAGDINVDLQLDGDDIQGFVTILLGN